VGVVEGIHNGLEVLELSELLRSGHTRFACKRDGEEGGSGSRLKGGEGRGIISSRGRSRRGGGGARRK